MRKRNKEFMQSVQEVVDYFNENESTVRETAEHSDLSKSTVHRYLTKILPNEESFRILAKNKAERHIRGGLATKKKFQNSKRNF